MQSLRIGRFLSRLGVCSRRDAADFLKNHRVELAGKRIHELNFLVPENSSDLTIDGKPVQPLGQRVILLLNKPRGYYCTRKKFSGQKSVYELLPSEYRSLYYAGRLDAASRGLMIFSNDGDLVYRLTHPSQRVRKKYIVRLNRPISPREMERMTRGVRSGKETLKADSIREGKQKPVYEFFLSTGKNHEIRRLVSSVGASVVDLQRVEMGEFTLGSLEEGKFKILRPEEAPNIVPQI